MVKYVIQQGCPIHHGTLYVPAIDKDNVPLLEFLHELGVPWTAAQSDLAILLGKPASLAALHDGGCPLSKDALYLAATCNSFDCFKFLHEHGCVWNTETYKAAERAATAGSSDTRWSASVPARAAAKSGSSSRWDCSSRFVWHCCSSILARKCAAVVVLVSRSGVDMFEVTEVNRTALVCELREFKFPG
jgi:hypothetical protein